MLVLRSVIFVIQQSPNVIKNVAELSVHILWKVPVFLICKNVEVLSDYLQRPERIPATKCYSFSIYWSKIARLRPSCDKYLTYLAVYPMHCILCIVIYELYSRNCILGILFNAVYIMYRVLFIAFFALFSRYCGICTKKDAFCSMRCVQCKS